MDALTTELRDRSENGLSYFIYREDYVHSFLLQATPRTLVLIRNLISNWTFFKSIQSFRASEVQIPQTARAFATGPGVPTEPTGPKVR